MEKEERRIYYDPELGVEAYYFKSTMSSASSRAASASPSAAGSSTSSSRGTW